MDAGRHIRAVLDKLGIDRADIVGHDIGVMVAYAYAARYPNKTSRLVVIDSPVPGIPPWDKTVRLPALWHFNFGGPDAERLVAGRERIYLDRFRGRARIGWSVALYLGLKRLFGPMTFAGCRAL